MPTSRNLDSRWSCYAYRGPAQHPHTLPSHTHMLLTPAGRSENSRGPAPAARCARRPRLRSGRRRRTKWESGKKQTMRVGGCTAECGGGGRDRHGTATTRHAGGERRRRSRRPAQGRAARRAAQARPGRSAAAAAAARAAAALEALAVHDAGAALVVLCRDGARTNCF